MKKSEYPELIVGGFIKNKKGELLFVTSHKWKGIWSIPGGHVELGESLVEALKREVMEEVGLRVKVTRLLSIEEAIYPKQFIRKKHFIFFDFLCETDSSRVRMDRLEIQGYRWVKPKEAMKLRHNEYTKHALKIYLGSKSNAIPKAIENKLLTP